MQKSLLLSLLMVTVIVTVNAMDSADGPSNGFDNGSHLDVFPQAREAIQNGIQNGWSWLVDHANTLKAQLPTLESDITQVPSVSSEPKPATVETPPQPAPSDAPTRSIKPVQPLPEQSGQPNLDPNSFKLPFINTTISKTTAVAGGVAVIALAGITYVLHKKGILKKAKQKLAQCPYALATVTAGLAAAGAGSYYYFAN